MSAPLRCPGCNDGTLLGAWPLRRDDPDAPHVAACTTCGGVWVRTEVLDALVSEAARAASSDGKPQRRALEPGRAITYRKCPECGSTMQRKNFGRSSGILLDVCAKHGTYFDYDELPGVLAFVKSGGLAVAAEQDRQERARNAKRPRFVPYGQPGTDFGYGNPYDRSHDPTHEFVAWASDMLGDDW